MPQEIHKILNRVGHWANQIDERDIKALYCGYVKESGVAIGYYYHITGLVQDELFPNPARNPNIQNLIKNVGFYIDFEFTFTSNMSSAFPDAICFSNGESKFSIPMFTLTNNVYVPYHHPIYSPTFKVDIHLEADKYIYAYMTIRYIPKQKYIFDVEPMGRPSALEGTITGSKPAVIPE